MEEGTPRRERGQTTECDADATSPIFRALTYGLAGWVADRAFTTFTRYRRTGRPAAPRPGLALIPIYALALPLFEPTHDSLRASPAWIRVPLYGFAFVAAEYAIGRVLRRTFGSAPWNYAGSRSSIDGLTRLDYIPLWAIAGLVLEALHDRLTSRPWRAP